MDLNKVLKMQPAEQLGYLQNSIVDYRCKTDPVQQGDIELPWVTATITAIDPEGSGGPSVFLEGRWLFLKNIEWRPNGGQQLKRVVPSFHHDERRDSVNTAENTKAEARRLIVPGPVAGAAGPEEYQKK